MKRPAEVRSRRLLIVVTRFSRDFGGVPESVLALALVLRRVGLECDVAATNGWFYSVADLEDLPAFGAIGDAAPVPLSIYDALLIAGPWNVHAALYIIRARRAGKPVRYAPKGGLAYIEFTRLRDFKKMLYYPVVELWVVLLANHVVFSSQLERRSSLVPRRVKQRALVLPDPFVSPLPPARPSRARQPFRVGFLAEISPRKGVHLLIPALLAISRVPSLPAWEAVIGGQPRPGSERYYDRTFKEATLLGRQVRWVGRVAATDRARFYGALDVLVVPSRFESFGFTVLEALSYGIPVVCSPRVGVLEYIERTAAVLVLRELTSPAIADALAQMMTSPKPCRAAAERFRGRGVAELSSTSLAQRVATALCG